MIDHGHLIQLAQAFSQTADALAKNVRTLPFQYNHGQVTPDWEAIRSQAIEAASIDPDMASILNNHLEVYACWGDWSEYNDNYLLVDTFRLDLAKAMPDLFSSPLYLDSGSGETALERIAVLSTALTRAFERLDLPSAHNDLAYFLRNDDGSIINDYAPGQGERDVTISDFGLEPDSVVATPGQLTLTFTEGDLPPLTVIVALDTK